MNTLPIIPIPYVQQAFHGCEHSPELCDVLAAWAYLKASFRCLHDSIPRICVRFGLTSDTSVVVVVASVAAMAIVAAVVVVWCNSDSFLLRFPIDLGD